MKPGAKSAFWLLGGLIAVGIALRFYRLDLHSLWGDELATWKDCWQPDMPAFWQSYFSLEQTPPLYFIFEFFVSRFFAATEWSMRILSVIFGIGFIAAGGAFAGSLFPNDARKKRFAQWIGASFVATSYRAILMSREARCYSLLFMLSALSGWSWLNVDFEAKTFRATRAWKYIAVAVLMSSTHYFGVLMVMAQGLSGLFCPAPRARLANWFKIYGVILICYAPVLAVVFFHNNAIPAHGVPPPLSEFFVATREFFGGSSVNSLLAFALAFAALFFVRGMERGQRLRVLSWLVSVFLLGWAISRLKTVYSTRYYMVALAPMLAVAAAGCAEILSLRLWAAGLLATIFCGLGLHETLIARHYFSEPQNEQIREASQAAARDLKEFPDAGLTVVQFSPFTTDLYMDQSGAARHFETLTPTIAELLHRETWPAPVRPSRQLIAMIFSYDDAEFGRMYLELAKSMKILRRDDFRHVSTAVLQP